MENKVVEKLNNLSLRELFDFYWLKMYPHGLTYRINDGEIKAVEHE
jgi:hypothetical protein